MSAELVDRLIKSFDDLENCIEVTKQVLRQKDGVPSDVISRVEQYTDVVAKQRGLASELQAYIDNQNWEEVARHVKLINGMSAMIRQDAQSILSAAMEEGGAFDKSSDEVVM